MTPWIAAHQASMSNYLQEFAQTYVHCVYDPYSHLIVCHPLLFLTLVFPRIRVFSNESALCVRWPKYWGFRISSSNEYSELISFKIDWFVLLAVQGTLKSLLQHYTLKVTIFGAVSLLYGPLSHLYTNTGKTTRCLC